MERQHHYNFCVVGSGLIGSSAAKYLSLGNSGQSVLLIGPSEPQDRNQTDIFGAWHDEGRITRHIHIDEIWGLLAQRSINNYHKIEQQSGIKFHHPVGYMMLCSEDGEHANTVRRILDKLGSSYSVLNYKQLQEKFPFFHYQRDEEGIYSQAPSGYISPRWLVAAQLQIAKSQGCTILDDIVNSVYEKDNVQHIVTDKGKHFTAEKVLLATGAFTHCRDLLPPGMEPNLHNQPETVILIEVNEAERRHLAEMPSLAVRGDEGPNAPPNIESYILPPIQYPDGKYYIKIGHGRSVTMKLETPSEISNWYKRSEVGLIENKLLRMAQRYFPGLSVSKYKFDHCVTSHTTSGYTYIDMLTTTLGVAIGGCGQAAKSSDEIGAIAARMIVKGTWDYDLPKKYFKFEVRTPASNL